MITTYACDILTLVYSTCKFSDIQVYVGMADFQHVVPVHAAQTRKRKRSDSQNDNENLGSSTLLSETLYFEDYQLLVMLPFLVNILLFWMTDKTGHHEADGDVMMLVPPLFSVKDRPTKIV
jgi:general transcription factor 3C polypeptide 5 (transcription factor C subunit 1)